MTKKKLYNMKCLVCGTIYLTNRINSATCLNPDCQEEHNREMARNRTKRRYEEEQYLNDYFAPKPKEKRKPNLVTPGWQIEAEARKHGMNYGQYYALMLQKQEIEERNRRKQIGE